MAQTSKTIKLRHSTATGPQRLFWASSAPFRLFAAGVGSGKTRAGCLEVFRMPPGSTGLICSPTYRMLQDSTLQTFLGLARDGNVLRVFNKSDMTCELVNGTTCLLRSADDPDKLRGTNLSWAFLDEAALMDHEVWLIVLARLREPPSRCWICTTPRGINHWLFETFVKSESPDYQVIRSSTKDNPFLPKSFVERLEAEYSTQWQRQEISGEFVELEGALFKRSWFSVVEHAPEALRWHRYWDLAASTKTTADYTASAAVALGADGIFYIRDMVHGKWEWPDAKRVIIQTMLNEPNAQHAIEEALHGLAAIQELRRDPSIAHVSLKGVRVDKDKVSRALPWAARAEAGQVKLIRGPWINSFLDEVTSFPHGHDDMVDSVSGGLQLLSKRREWTTIY